ncbi:TIGR01777 family oxidoreductase [Sanyastnella coralliicola]|uniref:TIGR01777 family oxidoreductase n=1 Tax=Sanyastnella coralliicola TaxID=3069118 RepID=UPI0027B8B0A2|nr:TIGR01777 family oxidoreductase [Longitalea sp. SCSIO 12813]
MNIVISGGSGLIGRQLTKALTGLGHHVTILTRSPEKYQGSELVSYAHWSPSSLSVDKHAIAESDVVINLAGATVAQRWTEKTKKAILDSRVNSTRTLVEAMKDGKQRVFLSASAIGLYPFGDDNFKEDHAPGSGFLSDVVRDWETEAMKAAQDGHRTALIRIGVVLAKDGGALERLVPIFKLGLGSAVGDGKQWQSWIHIDDLVNIFLFALENNLSGAYNAVAPNPVTNEEMSRQLAKALGKPFWAPNVPGFVLKMIFGDMSEVILGSQKVSAEKLEDSGFNFSFPDIDQALDNLF